MGALTFDALLRSLKQGVLDSVYYLHGDEDVLKDEAVRALVDRAVDPAARDFNLDQRSAPELDAEAFHALVNTPPMLAPEAGALLLDAVGSDLSALARELEKLAGLAGGGSRSATREDVAALVGVRRGETLQDLVDAALERRAAEAARLVAPILEQAGMSGVRLLTALGTHLVGTALARAELDQGAPRARLEALLLSQLRAARPFGLGSWEGTAARWARWAERWSARELEQAPPLP